jgi:hypothetical protein
MELYYKVATQPKEVREGRTSNKRGKRLLDAMLLAVPR